MDANEFLNSLAGQLVRDLSSQGAIGSLTTNPELKGAYAEALIRVFIKRAVAPLRVSRGAIISEQNSPQDVKQLDAIIWSPNPLPAIFEAEDFAIVTRGCAWGFLEVKSSNYKGTSKTIKEKLDLESTLLVRPAWFTKPDGRHYQRSIGVICIYDMEKSDGELAKLIEEKRVVAMLQKQGGSEVLSPRGADIFYLFNFLADISMIAAAQGFQIRVNSQLSN